MVDEFTSNVEARMDGDPDGTITVSGGQGPNFDDFDSMEESRSDYVESQTEKDTSKGSETVPEENRVSQDDPVDDKRIEADKNLEHSAEKDPEKIEIKFLKAKLGEDELDISPDTEIPVLVDGETQYYKLQDLMNHEAGQVGWDKRFGELSSERRDFKETKDQADQYLKDRDVLFQDIGKMHELIEQKKPYDAMEFLVAQSGGNPYAFKRALMEQMSPEFERLSMLTPEEQQAEFFQQENEYLRDKMRSSEQQYESESSDRAAQAQLTSERETRGISQEIYNQSSEELREIGAENVTPQLIMDHATMKPLVERSEHVVAQVSPNLVEDDGVVVELARIFREDPALTDAEAITLVRDSLGITAKEKLVTDKARASGQLRRQPENPGNHKYYGSSEPGDYDHIESFNDYEDL